MNINRITWGIVSLVVLLTLLISFVPITSHSQQDKSNKNQDTKGFGDMEKYPIADYDAPESSNASERNERREKSKRYDKRSFVIINPRPDVIMSTIYDAEPVPPALPFSESKLVVIGEILEAKASMSNDKGAVYSEYAVKIESVLKQMAGRELRTGKLIYVDRTGGRVRYPNGQTILYLYSEQGLPEAPGHGRYMFFLDNEELNGPNFKIITAYQFKDGKVSALDHDREFDGKDQDQFIKLVLSAKSGDKNEY